MVIVDFTAKLGPVPTDPNGMTVYAMSYWSRISDVIFGFTGKTKVVLITTVSPNQEMVPYLVDAGCRIFGLMTSQEVGIEISYSEDTVRATMKDGGNTVLVSFSRLITECE